MAPKRWGWVCETCQCLNADIPVLLPEFDEKALSEMLGLGLVYGTKYSVNQPDTEVE